MNTVWALSDAGWSALGSIVAAAVAAVSAVLVAKLRSENRAQHSTTIARSTDAADLAREIRADVQQIKADVTHQGGLVAGLRADLRHITARLDRHDHQLTELDTEDNP